MRHCSKHSHVKYSKPLSNAIGSGSSDFPQKKFFKKKIKFEANAVMFGELLRALFLHLCFFCSSCSFSDVQVFMYVLDVRTNHFKDLLNQFQKPHTVVFKMRSSF